MNAFETIDYLNFAIYLLLIFIAISIFYLFFVKYREKRKTKIINILVKDIANEVFNYLNKDENEEPIAIDETNLYKLKKRKKYSERLLISALNIASERIILPKELKDVRYYTKSKSKLLSFLVKSLKSKSKIKRINAAFALRFYGFDGVSILAGFLAKEKSSYVRLKICESLLFSESYDSIPLILDSAIKEYESKNLTRFSQYISILQPYSEHVSKIISQRYPYSKAETIIAIRLCRFFPNQDLEKILIESLLGNDDDLSAEAANVIYHIVPSMLDSQFFLQHKNLKIREFAIKSLGKSDNLDNLDRLLQLLIESENERFAILGIENALKRKDKFKDKLLNLFYRLDDTYLKSKLARILEPHLFYFFSYKDWFLDRKIMDLVENCIESGLIYNIVSYLNSNEDKHIEEILLLKIVQILDILNFKKPDYQKRMVIFDEIISSLNDDILIRYNLPPKKKIEPIKPPTASKKDKPLLVTLIVLLFLFPIFIFFLTNKNLPIFPFDIWLFKFIKSYIIFFGYYALILNLFSLILLIFANIEIKNQNCLNFSRSYINYFQKGVLPSISILVPAFREEATIVENVRSLLALKYPDFEVIVINDGSPDNTMKVLKENFELERIAYKPNENSINTAPIIGVYKSKIYSNLFVIDKVNGGKADSLNAGINLSNCDYVCGIDADSLLEQDALLSAALAIIESDDKVIATGGKILPVNGCQVKNGSLIKIGIGKNILALFQTIEYIRAFFTGRLGWSYIKSLLIISGAFGVFEKKSVFEIGGYMTFRTAAKQNTVGEDMELIVRLRRNALEKKEKSSIHYSIEANCWTEVPESFKILRKQRDRWQRGLIEILLYHRKLLFNKNYGRIGILALPYFFLFETLGPFYEVIGLFLSIIAFSLGILTLPLFLFLFISSILLGVLISILSLSIAEKNVLFFKWYEDLILVFISILENFGYRQLMNVIRLIAYFNYLIGKSSWGTMKRKGFKTK